MQNTLEFYMFERKIMFLQNDSRFVRKLMLKIMLNKEDPFSGGKFEFSYKTEMNIKEAEKYMLPKI